MRSSINMYDLADTRPADKLLRNISEWPVPQDEESLRKVCNRNQHCLSRRNDTLVSSLTLGTNLNRQELLSCLD